MSLHARGRRWPAVLGTLVVLAVAYLAFFKTLPFTHKFEIHAEFANAQNLTPGNPVRIAGLQVGSVTSVGSGPHHSAIVNIALSQPQLLHADATLTIKPRLLFEGNNYIDVSAGTPAVPAIRNGAVIPESQTSSSVPLQDLLNVFEMPVRAGLKSWIAALARGLGAGTSAPDANVPQGYQGLRDATQALDGALGSLAITAQAMRGTGAGDLSATIEQTGNVTAQLARDPAALADFVTSYNEVFGTLAARSTNLAQSLRAMLGLLSTAPPELRSIDAALPRLTSFANALQPTLGQAPPALSAASAALGQLDQTVAPPELPKLLSELAPVTRALPALEQRLRALMDRITPVSECVSRNIVPVLDKVVPDKHFGTGRPAWQDLVHLAAALAGASPDFDGNGTTIRLGVTESELALSSTVPGLGQLVGTGTGNIEGVDPLPLGPGIIPPLRPDAPCAAQPLPNLALRSAGPPASITTSQAPAPSAFLVKLARELLSGRDGQLAALKQLLAQVPLPSNPHARQRGRKRHVPDQGVARAQAPAKPPGSTGNAGPSAAPTTSGGGLLGVVDKLLGGGSSSGGGQGPLPSTLAPAASGLVGALGRR